jgi:hypothetical protein
MAKEFSKTFLIAAKCMRAAMQILHKNGGSMPSRQLMNEVEKTIPLSDWEKETTSKGGIRWQNVYHFTSVDYVVAGYIIKKNGYWYITPEGEAVLKMSDTEVQSLAVAAYRKWRKEKEVDATQEEIDDDATKENILNLEELEETAGNDRCLVVVRLYNLFDITKHKDIIQSATWTGSYFSDGGGWACGRIENVTHWMAYPRPPINEEESDDTL